MAKVTTPLIQLRGTLGGITFYTLNGTPVARSSNGPSAKRIKTDPAFANVRCNNLEFGGASSLAKSIRRGLAPVYGEFSESYAHSRLSGVCRAIIQKGKGRLGEREANLTQNGQLLVGFPLDKKQPLGTACSASFQCSAQNQRSTVTVEANILATHWNGYPNTATHARLTIWLSSIRNHNFNNNLNQYQAKVPAQNGRGDGLQSEPISLKDPSTQISVSLQAPTQGPPSPDVALLLFVGVTYMLQENGQLFPLKTGKAMECIAVL